MNKKYVVLFLISFFALWTAKVFAFFNTISYHDCANTYCFHHQKTSLPFLDISVFHQKAPSHLPQNDTIYLEEEITCSNLPYCNHGFDSLMLTAGDTILSFDSSGSHYKVPVTIFQAYEYNIYAINCVEDCYTENNFYACDKNTDPGMYNTYVQELQTINGCDSIVRLILDKYDITQSYTTFERTCQGSLFTSAYLPDRPAFQNIPTPQMGDFSYFDTLYGAALYGCDSFMQVNLTVFPSDTAFINDTVCDGMPYILGDSIYISAGSDSLSIGYHEYEFKIKVLHPMLGPCPAVYCDSTVFLSLHVGQVYHDIDVIDTVCFNDLPFIFADTAIEHLELDTSLQYNTFSFNIPRKTQLNCDSIFNLTLCIITPTNPKERHDTICQGDTLFFYGHAFTEPFSDSSIIICDSIYSLSLCVNPTYISSDSVSVCYGDTYQSGYWNINTIDSSFGVKTYTDTLKTYYCNCDSTFSLKLNILPKYHIETDYDVCMGTLIDTLEHAPFIAENDITLSHSYTPPFSCDSTVIIHIYVHPQETTDINAEICVGEVYNQNGFYIPGNTPGMKQATRNIHSFYGCDSTIKLHLMVHPTYNSVIEDDVCQYTPYYWQGSPIPTNNVGTISRTTTLQSIHGCDSTLNLTLNVKKSYLPEHDFLSDYTTTCQSNEPFSYNGFDNIDVSEPGAMFLQDTFQTTQNCDSVVLLIYDVYPSYQYYDTATITFAELPYSFNVNGTIIVFNTIGDSTIHYETIHGCDSSWYLHVALIPSFTTYDTISICESDLPYQHSENCIGNCTFNQAGSYDCYFFSQNGLDSLVKLTLYVYPSFVDSIYDAVCYGTPIDTLNHQFIATADSVFGYTYISTNGCDSTITLSLTVHPIFETQFEGVICQNESYTLHHFNIDGDTVACGIHTYRQQHSSIYGCDSVVLLHLTVDTVYHTNIDSAICKYDIFDAYNFLINSDYLTAGNHLFTKETEAMSGCDSLITLSLTVHPIPSANFATTQNTNCTDPFNGSIAINDLTGGNEFIFSVSSSAGGFVYEGYNSLITNLMHGNYTITITNEFGCDTTYLVEVGNNATDLIVSIIPENNISVCEQDTLLLTATASSPASFIWTFQNDTLSLENTLLLENITQAMAGQYTVNATDENNCQNSNQVSITVLPNEETHLFDTICQGETYTNNGFEIQTSAAGTLQDELLLYNQNGCDSVVHLHLTVDTVYHTSIDSAICKYDIFNAYHFLINSDSLTAGDHLFTQETEAMSGCDSLITLSLTVHPIPSANFATTQNTNCTAPFNGSIAINDLTGGNEFIFSVSSSAGGFVYEGDNSLITNLMHGNYTITITNEFGCDTTYLIEVGNNATDLIVSITPENNISVCEQDTLLLTATASSPASFIWTFQNDTISLENTLLLENITQAMAGQYTVNATDENNCQNSNQVSITVLPNEETHLFDTICQGETYTNNGFDIQTSATGTLQDELLLYNQNGCDSVVLLHLTVDTVYHTNIDSAICKYDIFNAYHFLINSDSLTVGNHSFTQETEAMSGCDSLITLSLTVHPIPSANFATTQNTNCTDPFNGSIAINDLTGGNEFIFSVSSSAGGFVYEGENSLITNLMHGNYTIAITNEFGCDTTYLVEVGNNATDLIVSITPENNISVCEQDTLLLTATASSPASFIWTFQNDTLSTENTLLLENITQAMAGQYTVNATDENNCQNSNQVSITVFPNEETHLFDTICQGETYTNNGFDIQTSAAGTLQDELLLYNQNGCDSVVHLHLTVDTVYHTNIDSAICKYDIFNAYHFLINSDSLTAGDHLFTQETEAMSGCDSLITLSLTVHPIPSANFATTQNTNCTAPFNGSIAINDLTGGNEFIFSVSSSAGGFVYEGDNSLITNLMHGNYTITITNEFGCDTTYLIEVGNNATDLIVSIIPENNISVCEQDTLLLTATASSPASFIWTFQNDTLSTENTLLLENITQAMAGQYTVNATDENNCQNSNQVSITVYPNEETHLFDTICQGETYTNNGFDIQTSAAGTLQDELLLYNQNGCDSVVLLHLTVDTVYHTNIDSAICKYDIFNAYHFLINSDSLTVGNHYFTKETEAMSGCDSLITLSLTVHPIPSANFATTQNTNCTAPFNGSIAINDLTGGNEFIFSVSSSTGGLIYEGDNNLITNLMHGNYTITITNEFGCDTTYLIEVGNNATDLIVSIIPENNISVCEQDTLLLTATASSPASFIWTFQNDTISLENTLLLENITQAMAGQYTVNATDENNCQNSNQVSITVFPNEEIHLFDTICQGETYTNNGFDIQTSVAGTLQDELLLYNQNGCDSVVLLNLFVAPIYQEDAGLTDEETVCASSLPFIYHGYEFSDSGTYLVTLHSRLGCDSVISLTIHIDSLYFSMFSEEICEGESYIWNDTAYSESGYYENTFVAGNDCDSIVALVLTVHPVFHLVVYDTTCQSDELYTSSLYPDFSNINVSLSGTFEIDSVFSTAYHCDSTVQLSLTVHEVYHTEIHLSECEGNEIQIFGQPYIVSTDTLFDTVYTSSIKCDSIVEITLTSLPFNVYEVVGGGKYCNNDTNGRTITLTHSDLDVSYSLYHNQETTPIQILQGTGEELIFGPFLGTGKYTIYAESNDGCSGWMIGVIFIEKTPQPPERQIRTN